MIHLGNKIRELRRSRDISQETLANHLGVSFQAVSKWETGATLPDVTLVPAIASFFGVSTDELFDFNRYEIEREVETITLKAYQHRRSGEFSEAEIILRDGLKRFPGNDVLLCNLLYVVDATMRSKELISLCEGLIETTSDDALKYDAYRILAETYKAVGKDALVKPTLEKIPEIYFSKLELMAQLLDGEEAWVAAHKELGISLERSLSMLFVIGQQQQAKGLSKGAQDSYMKGIKILEAIEAGLSNPGWGEYHEQFYAEIKALTE